MLYLRRLGDCEAIKAAFATAKRVAIIGAGWIGLETAAAARAAGVEATVLEMAPLPLRRRARPGDRRGLCRACTLSHGVDLATWASMSPRSSGWTHRAPGVRLDDGEQIDADAVVVGVGITPNTELAEAAGLIVDNGILVDEYLTSSDPDVFAAGDVANAYYPSLAPPAPRALVGGAQPGTRGGGQHDGPDCRL